MGFEFSSVVELRAQLAAFTARTDAIHMKVANRIGLLALRKVMKMTPVDTGDLRQNWKHGVIKNGNDYTIWIQNLVEYAGYVENGHRIVIAGQTVGWVEGRFMMKLTLADMKRIAPNMWKKEVEKEMRRVFGN